MESDIHTDSKKGRQQIQREANIKIGRQTDIETERYKDGQAETENVRDNKTRTNTNTDTRFSSYKNHSIRTTRLKFGRK